jgi:type VI secretion system protein VasD
MRALSVNYKGYLFLSLCVLVTGCASHDPIPVNLTAADGVNPDSEGRPSPIVTRVYQLSSRDKFALADPIQLIEHDQATLGSDEIGRDEVVLQPGDKHLLTLPRTDNLHFIGIVAAYQAIDQADWREVVSVPEAQRLQLDVTVGPTGLQIQGAGKDSGSGQNGDAE